MARFVLLAVLVAFAVQAVPVQEESQVSLLEEEVSPSKGGAKELRDENAMKREEAKVKELTKVAETRGGKEQPKVDMKKKDTFGAYSVSDLASVDASLYSAMADLKKHLPEGRAAAEAARLKTENEMTQKSAVKTSANAEKTLGVVDESMKQLLGAMNMKQKGAGY